MHAADNGHPDCVRLLLEKEGGMQNSDGWTALMFATYNNRLGCVRLLAEKEKDLKLTHESHGFPLAQQPLTLQRGRATRRSPPSSVDSICSLYAPAPSKDPCRSVCLFVSVHGQARRPSPAAPSEDEPHVHGSQRVLPGPQEQLARCLAEAPLGTAGGPVQPGSIPRPQPAHVHHLASGWSCRCVLRN